MLRPSAMTCSVLIALLGGCADETSHSAMPTLASVWPRSAYTDQDVRLVIDGGGFVPSYRIDSRTGFRITEHRSFAGRVGPPGAGGSVALSDFDWRGPSQVSATLQHGLPVGVYAVTVRDPRGHSATLPAAFTSLGPDETAPSVTWLAPEAGTLVAPGTRIVGRFIATDQAPGNVAHLAWEIHGPGAALLVGDTCVEQVSCAFDTVVPEPLHEGDVIELRATARDNASAANQATASLFLRLRAQPTVTSVAPTYGGTAGGTDLVIRGRGFLPGSTIFFDDLPLPSDSVVVVDEQTVSLRTPTRAPGLVDVTVRNALGSATQAGGFEYRSPPSLYGSDPDTGPAEGGIAIKIWGLGFTKQTVIYFGNTLARARPLLSAQLSPDGDIRGTLPAGLGQTSLWAVDPELGWSQLSDGFVWLP